MNHINEKTRAADSYARGLVNDHVSVLHTTSAVILPLTQVYHVYARRDYNVGKGPRPMPKQECEYFEHERLDAGEKPRGWGHIDIIRENVSSLDEAMRLAEPEAKERGVVLLLDDLGTTIKWHPEGWQPRIG